MTMDNPGTTDFNTKEFICPHCGQSFNGKFALDYHIKNLHLPHPPGYVCPKCGATFELDYELEEHLAIEHPPTQPYGVWWLAALPVPVLVVMVIIMVLARSRALNGYLMMGFAFLSLFSGALAGEKGFHPKKIYAALAWADVLLGIGALICTIILLAPFGIPEHF